MPSQAPIRILLIDDHSNVHFTIAKMLEFSDDMLLIGQGSSGDDAIRLCAEYHPDIVLMDVIMPGLSGIEATAIIKTQYPAIKVIALSGFHDHESIQAMMEAGATGYILKTASMQDIANTIRTAYEGKIVVSAEVMSALLHPTPPSQTGNFGLTGREIEVLSLMVKGFNNSEIADALTVSLSTIKHHVSNILTKMGVTSRVEAVAIAIKYRLVT